MADVKGLLADPEFQKLDMPTQKSTLGKLDPEFSTLSDGDYVKFRAGMTKPVAPSKDTRLPFGKFGAGPHKSFAETVGPDTALGKTATFLGKASNYLPSAESVMAGGVPAEGATAGLAAVGKRAVGIGASVGTGYSVDKGLEHLGAPWWVREGLAGAAALFVGSKMSPEIAAKVEEGLQSTGLKGQIKKWLIGKTPKDEAYDMFEKAEGRKPVTFEDKALAEARAAKIKADIRKTVFDADKVAKPPKEAARPGTGSTVKKFGGTAEPGRDLPRSGSKPAGKAAKWEGGSIREQKANEPPTWETVGKETSAPENVSRGTSVESETRYSSTAEGGQTSSRNLDLGKVGEVQAKAKDLAAARRFKETGLTREKIKNMTEAEWDAHRVEINKIRKAKGQPQLERLREGPNRRTFAELKADFLRAFDRLE
jgi:hypothetical protein